MYIILKVDVEPNVFTKFLLVRVSHLAVSPGKTGLSYSVAPGPLPSGCLHIGTFCPLYTYLSHNNITEKDESRIILY